MQRPRVLGWGLLLLLLILLLLAWQGPLAYTDQGVDLGGGIWLVPGGGIAGASPPGPMRIPEDDVAN